VTCALYYNHFIKAFRKLLQKESSIIGEVVDYFLSLNSNIVVVSMNSFGLKMHRNLKQTLHKRLNNLLIDI
jgi:hypothetical protein